MNPGFQDDSQQVLSVTAGARKSRHGGDLLAGVADAKQRAAKLGPNRTSPAADALAAVADGKQRAAALDPNRDVSASNAAKARAARWPTTS